MGRLWPTSEVEPFATFINSIRKHGATSSELDQPWNNTFVMNKPPTAYVRDLKQQPGGDIGIHASTKLARSLISARLVDHLGFVVPSNIAGHRVTGTGGITGTWRAAQWPSATTSVAPPSGSSLDRYSREMRPVRYSINVTLDGCCDHRAIPADEDLHRHAAETINQADALLLGRVTYEMMESAWRPTPPTGARPDWMESFAQTINAAKKYVVSSTLEQVDWNAELVRGDLGKAVQQLKRKAGKGLFVGGVKLPLALAELGLIDEYEFVVHPRLAGHGPTLFAGLSKHVDLNLVSRLEFDSGAVAMRYEPSR